MGENTPADKTQKTPQGAEIRIPTWEEVLRDLKKVAKAKPSKPKSRPKK